VEASGYRDYHSNDFRSGGQFSEPLKGVSVFKEYNLGYASNMGIDDTEIEMDMQDMGEQSIGILTVIVLSFHHRRWYLLPSYTSMPPTASKHTRLSTLSLRPHFP
jgi:hypothetical protein